MTINENLKNARLCSGLTQEQVAQQVGITRQALSYYESGRSQPDIDMLISLCKVYNTDINEILYGKKKSVKAYKAVCIVALSLAVAVFLLTFVSAFLLSYADMFYPVSEGQVHSDEAINLMIKVSLWDKIKVIDAVNLSLSFWGYLALLVLILSTKTHVPLNKKLVYTGVLTLGVLAVPALFAIINPSEVYTLQEYITNPLFILIRVWVMLLALCIAEFFIRKRKITKQE